MSISSLGSAYTTGSEDSTGSEAKRDDSSGYSLAGESTGLSLSGDSYKGAAVGSSFGSSAFFPKVFFRMGSFLGYSASDIKIKNVTDINFKIDD